MTATKVVLESRETELVSKYGNVYCVSGKCYKLRAVAEDEGKRILFVAKDISSMLGYLNPYYALKKFCKDMEQKSIPHPKYSNVVIKVNVIGRESVGALMQHAGNTPEVSKFRQWLFSEAIPAIRGAVRIDRKAKKQEKTERKAADNNNMNNETKGAVPAAIENNVQVFTSKQFGNIRMIEENDKILFVASDVAKALGYAKPANAIATHCRYTLKRGIPHPQSKGASIEVSVIPEGDVYRLITHSKLPAAQKFESWVFDEVLPTIRKHEAYMTPSAIEKAILNPDFIINLASKLKEEMNKRKEAELKVEEYRPKVEFADKIVASNAGVSVGDFAKILCQNGTDIGQNRLFNWLRGNGYMMRKGNKNIPTQQAVERHLFEVEEYVFSKYGKDMLGVKCKITPKGQQHFMRKFLGIGKEATELVK